MTTTSAEGKLICCQVLVLILEFTKVTALGLSLWVYLQVGYATLQCVLALVLLNEFRAGSCMAKMSQSFEMGLLRRVSWAVWEVLRFCCQMQSWDIMGCLDCMSMGGGTMVVVMVMVMVMVMVVVVVVVM